MYLWPLIKRGVVGTYHKVSRKYLPRFTSRSFSPRQQQRKSQHLRRSDQRMLKTIKSLIAFSIALCVVLTTFLWAEKLFSNGFQSCVAQHVGERSSDNGSQAAEKNNNGPSATVVLANVRCSGDFIDKHNGSITALATFLIAAFTMTLWWVGAGQYDLLEQQILLTRDEFIATHRPRLRVRRFMPRLNEGLPVAAHFIVVNVGESRAHIKGFEIRLLIQPAVGSGFTPSIQPMELRTLEPGEAVLYIAVANLNYVDELGIASNFPGSRFEIRGEIEYADDLGVIRRTGFWRVRTPQAEIVKRDDPRGDFEYED